MLENGTIIANRYEILGKIGTGGTADVYKAKCHKLNRFVAIKVLKREFSEDRNFISKFRIEAQSAAGMTHGNVVNVYDVGDENGIYYIVMELVEGITLKQYIDKKGALGYKEAISIAIQIAQGIEAAHKHNIIHRDIKPQNIIISREGKVKVTDFGIAKVTNTDTVNSMAMGSVHYISPEQARGGFSDITSDIYSFGITLYEMCTGTVPFDGETTVSVALMHIQNEIIPPTAYNPEIPLSVENIIMKCTQKRMDRRYPSATDLIVDLKRALITPYDDFVVMPGSVDTSPTVLFTQDELDEINAVNARKQMPESDPYMSNVMPGIDMTGFEKMVTDNSIDLTHIYDDEYEEHYEYSSDDNEAEEDDDEVVVERDDNKIDKIMVWIGIAVAVIIVIITIGVVFRVFITFNGMSDNQTTAATKTPTVAAADGVEVPKVIGLTEEEAMELLNPGLGFRAERVASESIAAGIIFEQSVEAGTFVAQNTPIVCKVSTGPAKFELSSILNMTEDEAKLYCTGVNLIANIEYEYSNDYEQGKVMKSIPIAGSQVKAGDTINIVVSRGKQNSECEVPRIVGMDESAARQAIEAVGLVPKAGGTVSSTTVAVGLVVAQNYPQGTKLAAGTEVEYVLSNGNTNKTYRGQITMDPQWFMQSIEGFVEEGGMREVSVVIRQSLDGQEFSTTVLEYTNVTSISDYTVSFNGIVDGVTEATVDIYIRYSWPDPATSDSRTEVQSLPSMTVTLTEAGI